MAFDYPFQFLNSKDASVLDSASGATDAYINCLAMLQALLAPLSSGGIFKTFDNYKSAENSIKESLQKIPWQTRGELLKNIETAFEILKEAQSADGKTSRTTIRTVVDRFLDLLVIQYLTLRQGGTADTGIQPK